MAINPLEYDRLIKDIEKVNRRFVLKMDKLLISLSNKGVLEVDEAKLGELEKETRKALQEAGYTETMQNFFEVFPFLAKNLFNEYKIAEIRSKRQDNFIVYAKNKLSGSQFNTDVVNVLTDSIREGAFLGKEFTEQKTILADLLVEKNLLTNYVTTTANDLMYQYRGTINSDIKEKYNPKYFNYLGREVETSRPICSHLIDNFGARISVDELKKVLDEYAPNGIPSEEVITYETVNGIKKKAKKGSGMIKGTNIDNFDVVRGGYYCQHEVVWVL